MVNPELENYVKALPQEQREGALRALELEAQNRTSAPAAPKLYPLAPRGLFWSLQGEGHLRGFQMGFVRLAGCSVGCASCDTDYSVAEKVPAEEITRRAFLEWPHDRDQWVWITGGEPTDHDLGPLLKELRKSGYSTALATSGARRMIPPVDWLSVSPHSIEPEKFMQRYGSEIKLVDGLNGMDLEAWAAEWDGKIDYMYRYVQPLSLPVRETTDSTTGRARVYREDPYSLERCLAFLRRHPRWALSRQDHHHWGVS